MEIKNRKLQRPKKVRERTGLGRTSVWSKSRDPSDPFPSPVQIGANSIGYFEDEINEWLENRPRVPCRDGTIKVGLEATGGRGTAAA